MKNYPIFFFNGKTNPCLVQLVRWEAAAAATSTFSGCWMLKMVMTS